MEKINDCPNEAAPIINKLSPDDITRCINCNLICSLQLKYNEGIPIMNKLNEDDIPRCIDCNLICSLQLNYKEGIPMINIEFEN